MENTNTNVSDAGNNSGANFEALVVDLDANKGQTQETQTNGQSTENANTGFPEGFFTKETTTEEVPSKETTENVDGAGDAGSTDGNVDTGSDESGESEFKLEIPEPAVKETTTETPAVEYDWSKIAETAGLKIEDNTQDALVNAIKAKAEPNLDAVREEARISFEKEFIETLPEDIKGLYEYTKAGGDAANYKGAFEQINTLKALSNLDLVQADLEARTGWTDEMVSKELDMLIEKGAVDHEAAKLRVILDNNEARIKNNLIAEQQQKAEQAQQLLREEQAKETTQIREALSKMKEFVGAPVEQKHIDYLMTKWESGEIKNDFASNADKVAKFMMWDTFGEQAMKNFAKERYQAGKQKVQAKVSNIPMQQTEGTSAPVTRVREESLGNFEALRRD